MRLDVRPIVSALRRNRIGAILVALQIAVSLAVSVNATYIVKQRIDRIGRPTGIDVENIFMVFSVGYMKDFDNEASLHRDLAYLRSVPGVIAATPLPINSIPLSGAGGGMGLSAKPFDKSNVQALNFFTGDEQIVKALGVRLVAGRPFLESEVLPLTTAPSAFPPQIIVTQPLARDLFPDQSALGKTVYNEAGAPATIVGIVGHMHGAWVGWDRMDRVALQPQFPDGPSVNYLVRTQPGQLNKVMRMVEATMPLFDQKRLISWVGSLHSFKENSYHGDRNMAIFLSMVTALLLAVSALGIFGLATFNVTTRTKQIGTRRAVGARRRDIVRYFMVENWLITTAGVLVGCGLALGVGYWLSLAYQLPRLDLFYLIGGVLLLWVLGQLAAWQPARRAAAVSPAVATRTV